MRRLVALQFQLKAEHFHAEFFGAAGLMITLGQQGEHHRLQRCAVLGQVDQIPAANGHGQLDAIYLLNVTRIVTFLVIQTTRVPRS